METRPPRVLSETRYPMVSSRFLTLVSALLLAFTAALANAAQSPPPEAKRRFDVPAGDATQTLARFAEQADREIVFSPAAVRGVQTNAVRGDFPPREALDLLVARTPLVVSRDTTTGALAVRKGAVDPNSPRAAPLENRDRPAPSTGRDYETVELSPFVVNTARDLGYLAENTLAGSRLNTKLRDTPGSISVFTREFLDDLGINDIRQLVEYSVNSEVDVGTGAGGPNQNTYIDASNLNVNVRTRGISASQGLDYFTSIAPADSYRVGRYDDSRGPNSILFGISNAGGIINQSSKLAATHRDSSTVRYTMGSWDSSRIELEANRVLRPDRLAFNLAAVQQENGGWRNFDFKDKKRLFGAVVFRPVSQLTVNVTAETGRDINAIIRTLTDTEEVLAWYDNRAALGVNAVTFTPNNAVPTAAQTALGVTGRNGASGGLNHRLTYVENDGVFFDAIGTYLTGTYNNNAVKLGGLPGVTGGPLKLADFKIYPTFNNAAGPGMSRYQSLSNTTAFADWQLTKNLFLNLGHNYQRTDVLINLLVNSDPTLRGDPNRSLGIGGPQNPYVGRLYFDGNWNRDIAARIYRESRVSLSYNFQPKAQWLGTHRLAGMLSHSTDTNERVNSWLVLAGHPFNPSPFNTNNRVTVRNYLTEGDYKTYRVGDWRSLPATINFLGKSYGTTYANVPADRVTNGGSIQFTNSRLAVVQSHFLRDRLITTLGYRTDLAKLIRFGVYSDPEVGDVVDRDPAKQTAAFYPGRTVTAGAVYHLFDWVSLLANRSTSVGVPSVGTTIFPDGRLAAGPRGRGTDYGLDFRLLEGRFNAKLVYFTSNEQGKTTAAGQFRQRNPRIMDALAGVLVGPGRPFSQSQWDPIYLAYTPPVTSTQSELDSTGYEARITANLTTNWRFMANYAYNDYTNTGIYSFDVIPWYGLKLDASGRLAQGVSQNASGQYLINPSAYTPDGAVAKWLELGAMAPAANPAILTTSTGSTVAQEIFDLVDQTGANKVNGDRRWGLRPHRIALFTAYDFRQGFLKGFTVGGGWRWRSPNVIGADPSGREITGAGLASADLMLRYARKFPRLPGRLSFQINISNLFDKTDIVPVRLLTDDPSFTLPGGHGVAYSRYDVVDPREIRFTTTYTF